MPISEALEVRKAGPLRARGGASSSVFAEV